MTDGPEEGQGDETRHDDSRLERQLPPARRRVRLAVVSSQPGEERAEADSRSVSESSAKATPVDYKVGYRSPPKHTQFKKGQIANPKGRPKGAKSLSTLVDEALSAQVKVRIGGRTMTTSKRDVMVKQYVEKAMRGDMKAFAMLVKLDPKARLLEAGEGASPLSAPDSDDIAAVVAFINRSSGPQDDEQ